MEENPTATSRTPEEIASLVARARNLSPGKMILMGFRDGSVFPILPKTIFPGENKGGAKDGDFLAYTPGVTITTEDQEAYQYLVELAEGYIKNRLSSLGITAGNQLQATYKSGGAFKLKFNVPADYTARIMGEEFIDQMHALGLYPDNSERANQTEAWFQVAIADLLPSVNYGAPGNFVAGEAPKLEEGSASFNAATNLRTLARLYHAVETTGALSQASQDATKIMMEVIRANIPDASEFQLERIGLGNNGKAVACATVVLNKKHVPALRGACPTWEIVEERETTARSDRFARYTVRMPLEYMLG